MRDEALTPAKSLPNSLPQPAFSTSDPLSFSSTGCGLPASLHQPPSHKKEPSPNQQSQELTFLFISTSHLPFRTNNRYIAEGRKVPVVLLIVHKAAAHSARITSKGEGTQGDIKPLADGWERTREATRFTGSLQADWTTLSHPSLRASPKCAKNASKGQR
ncbi:unnamed protein product [Rangifer tarandus platyrhynchus]|uniref:Uncharacterized protein n=1 Tax=Rangifer tarandus platyrhynchus TaxID=3082113 RepID=A0AC59Z1N0_RANTA